MRRNRRRRNHSHDRSGRWNSVREILAARDPAVVELLTDQRAFLAEVQPMWASNSASLTDALWEEMATFEKLVS